MLRAPFEPAEAFAASREYRLLPFRFDRVRGDDYLLTNLVGHGPRLIRHEPHGLNDPAAFFVDGFVVRADQPQQYLEIGNGGIGSHCRSVI